MTITFVLPFVNLTGGVRLLLQYANWLHDHGDAVTVVYPLWPYRFHFPRVEQFRELRKAMWKDARVPWLDVRCRLVRAPLIAGMFVPRADVVVVTSWPAVHDVARLDHSRGSKVHVVFHHETGTGPERRIVESYALPFHRIAASQHVRQTIERRFGCTIHDIVAAGIDSEQFYPEGERAAGTVLMLYHDDPRKGATDAMAALAIVKQHLPQTRVRMCGTVRPRHLPSWAEFEFCPADDELRRRYSTSTVFLYPSRDEGFGLPPLEAMACGCPVVTTNVGATADYANASNARVVRPGDAEGMASAMIELLTMPGVSEALSVNGRITAAAHSLSSSAKRFRDALCRRKN